MRRRLAFLLVWSLGTAAMVGACWLGLRSVVDAAVPQRTAPFSAAELGRILPSPSVSADAAQPATVAMAATPTTPPPTTPAPVPTSSAPATPTAGPTPGWVAVQSGRHGTAYTRTFHLQGGDISFWCDPNDVHVTDADLRPGYTLMQTRYDYRSLLISLISTDRASRVYVSWQGGPYAEITEAID